MTSLDGLEALTTIEGTLTIANSRDLVSLDALAGLDELNGLTIYNCHSLPDLDGLHNVTQILGTFHLGEVYASNFWAFRLRSTVLHDAHRA